MVMGSLRAINMLTAAWWPVKEQVRTPAQRSSENLSRIVPRLPFTEAGLYPALQVISFTA